MEFNLGLGQDKQHERVRADAFALEVGTHLGIGSPKEEVTKQNQHIGVRLRQKKQHGRVYRLMQSLDTLGLTLGLGHWKPGSIGRSLGVGCDLRRPW
eukprot:1136894-Pelagomonas_calceolata.AAC.5